MAVVSRSLRSAQPQSVRNCTHDEYAHKTNTPRRCSHNASLRASCHRFTSRVVAGCSCVRGKVKGRKPLRAIERFAQATQERHPGRSVHGLAICQRWPGLPQGRRNEMRCPVEQLQCKLVWRSGLGKNGTASRSSCFTSSHPSSQPPPPGHSVGCFCAGKGNPHP